MGGFVPASGGHIPAKLLAVVVVAGGIQDGYTLSPILRRLRIVRSMVDMMCGRSYHKQREVACPSDVRDRSDFKVAQAPLKAIYIYLEPLSTIPSPNNDNPMITRRAFTCVKLQRRQIITAGRCNHGSIQRRLASTFVPPPASPPPSSLSPLSVITSELDKISPRFDIDADEIEIIRGPVEFFDVLKVRNEYISTFRTIFIDS